MSQTASNNALFAIEQVLSSENNQTFVLKCFILDSSCVLKEYHRNYQFYQGDQEYEINLFSFIAFLNRRQPHIMKTI